MPDEYLEKIPELRKEADTPQDAGLMNWTALTAIPVAKNTREFLILIAVAFVVVGGAELLIRLSQIPSYIVPLPSAVFSALVSSMPLMLPHIGTTLQELLIGYFIGSLIGIVLAGVITQFPFIEKVITPYVIVLVTTPMLALVPLLVLRLGFGLEPRIVAVALAVGPMVMINSATGFRRTDLGKIALARSYGASTLQIFRTIRFPIALPMIIVGLMVGGIFGLLTAIGAEMLGGQSGLGTRLVYYSSLARMENFFATILIIAFIGILMYVIFFFIGKRWASWEA
jgi:NitT/TauT family transport system permease protein